MRRFISVQASVLFVDQNVTFFPRFTFYLTENGLKTPALGVWSRPWRQRRPSLRSSLCLNYRSKRHVFSAIYLLFNRKTPKNPCIRRARSPWARGPSSRRSSLCLICRSKRHVFWKNGHKSPFLA